MSGFGQELFVSEQSAAQSTRAAPCGASVASSASAACGVGAAAIRGAANVTEGAEKATSPLVKTTLARMQSAVFLILYMITVLNCALAGLPGVTMG